MSMKKVPRSKVRRSSRGAATSGKPRPRSRALLGSQTLADLEELLRNLKRLLNKAASEQERQKIKARLRQAQNLLAKARSGAAPATLTIKRLGLGLPGAAAPRSGGLRSGAGKKAAAKKVSRPPKKAVRRKAVKKKTKGAARPRGGADRRQRPTAPPLPLGPAESRGCMGGWAPASAPPTASVRRRAVRARGPARPTAAAELAAGAPEKLAAPIRRTPHLDMP